MCRTYLGLGTRYSVHMGTRSRSLSTESQLVERSGLHNISMLMFMGTLVLNVRLDRNHIEITDSDRILVLINTSNLRYNLYMTDRLLDCSHVLYCTRRAVRT